MAQIDDLAAALARLSILARALRGFPRSLGPGQGSSDRSLFDSVRNRRS